MASPVTIQASHPTSHLFKEHSGFYSEGLQARRLRESAMVSHRVHPYQRERSHSPSHRGNDYWSSGRRRESDIYRQQERPSSRGAPFMRPSQSMPSQFGASGVRSSQITSDTSRIPVGHLVDAYSSARHSPVQGEPRYQAQASSSNNISPARGPNDQMEPARLPGIDSVSQILHRKTIAPID